jgi:hypothetical protein
VPLKNPVFESEIRPSKLLRFATTGALKQTLEMVVGANGDAPVSREVAFEPVEPKTWQLELFGPRHNVKPRQHSGRLFDELRAHATPVVVLIQASQTAMQKTPYHCNTV